LARHLSGIYDSRIYGAFSLSPVRPYRVEIEVLFQLAALEAELRGSMASREFQPEVQEMAAD
jgi:hypothetical protein